MSEKKRRALVVVGHGSHFNGNSAASLLAHVNTLRKCFWLSTIVVPAFWKEEPSLREVVRSVNAHQIVIVPLFISEGYFTDQILPRELGLAQATPNSLSWIDGKAVIYAAPVGTHPAMSQVLLERARDVVAKESVSPAESALIVVGHGTPRHARSSKSIHDQVERLRAKGEYAEVAAVFMDEPPYVEDVLTLCDSANIIMVPYFIADGLHTQEDIPSKLGLRKPGAKNGSYSVPARLADRRLWYTSAVGTAPAVVEVILARASEALEKVALMPWPTIEPVAARAHRTFAQWARKSSGKPSGGLPFGQLMIQATPEGGFVLSHIDEARRSKLRNDTLLSERAPSKKRAFTNPYAAEQIARYDDEGHFRPLKAAPTLRRGWRLQLESDQELRHALDAFYPGAVVSWYDKQKGQLNPTPFFETAARQSGRYRCVKRITSPQARRAIRACCQNEKGCIKQIAWELGPKEPLGIERGKGLIPCREACGFLIEMARQIVISKQAA